MSDRQLILDDFDRLGIDPNIVLRGIFLDYKNRKKNNCLNVNDGKLPTSLIMAYYTLNEGEIKFDQLKRSFMRKYIQNESELEGVNDETIHGKEEIEGLKDMYKYIYSSDIDYMFDVFTLKELHSKLFSHTPHPECAGDFRRMDVFLPGTGIPLTEWRMIFQELRALDSEVLNLYLEAQNIKALNQYRVDTLLNYLDRLVELKCKLIKIHPFLDGNGRTVRGFINKLMGDAGLPPIYVKSTERLEYQDAMYQAIMNHDYTEIKNFYRYKVCDSIVELDINERLKRDKGFTRTRKKEDE